MTKPTFNKNKAGEIISARIRVCDGYNLDGTKRTRSRTLKKPLGMSDAKFTKLAQEETLKDEMRYKEGYELDKRKTFAEYAAYVMDCKASSGVKRSTLDRYASLLRRINAGIGAIKLQDLRPQHLTQFYKQLKRGEVRVQPATATPAQDFKALLRSRKLTQAALATCTGIPRTTISGICKGHVTTLENAVEIAKALQMKRSELFTVKKNTKPLSQKTIIEHHVLISEILSQAEKEMLVPYNAAKKVTNLPKATKRTTPNYFQPETLLAIRAALQEEPLKWRVLVHLMMVTGCRRGEIVGLKWSAIDLEKKTIRIENNLLYSKTIGAYEETPKTESSVRSLFLSDGTVALLQEYREEWQAMRKQYGTAWNSFLQIPDGSGTLHTVRAEYLFVMEQTGKVGYPMHPDSPTRFLNNFSARHGLPHINPHAFRHSLASMLGANGFDVVTVSELLGHSNTSTTMNIYEHVIESKKEEAANFISDFFLRKQA